MYCAKDIATNFKYANKSKIYFENFTRISNNQKTLIIIIQTEINNALNKSKNIMNQTVLVKKLHILLQIVFNIDISLNDISYKYFLIIKCFEEITNAVSKLFININVFQLIYMNSNDLKSILDAMNFLCTVSGKCADIVSACKEIWEVLKNVLRYPVKLYLFETIFYRMNIILNIFRLINDILNNFLDKIKDLLNKQKICIAKAFGETNILEIIYENVDWLKICNNFIDLLKLHNDFFSRICCVIQGGREMVLIFYSLLENSNVFCKTLYILTSSVICIYLQ